MALLTEDALELVAVCTTVLAAVALLEDAVVVQPADGRTGDVLGLVDVAVVASRLGQLDKTTEDDTLVVGPLKRGDGG